MGRVSERLSFYKASKFFTVIFLGVTPAVSLSLGISRSPSMPLSPHLKVFRLTAFTTLLPLTKPLKSLRNLLNVFVQILFTHFLMIPLQAQATFLRQSWMPSLKNCICVFSVFLHTAISWAQSSLGPMP